MTNTIGPAAGPNASGAAPTLEVVAAAAGVSRSTVSRVINDSTKVTPEAVAAVSAAIAELGYVPNRAARSLASRRTQSVALVIPEETARFFADPYFATVVQGIAMFLADTDYTLTLLIAAENQGDKTRRYLRGGSVDGAVILSHHRDDTSWGTLAGAIPIVFGGRPMSAEGADACYVDIDNVAAATEITEHLLSRGHRRVATIAGPQNMAAGLDRLTGWRRVMAAAGAADDLVEVGDFTPASGAAAARRLLERGVPFDGLFVASAQMASGALGVLREQGVAVPGDVGVVTIDDDYFAQTSLPPLTTVEQPTEEVGRRVAQVLLQLIDGKPTPRVTILPTRIVERGSEG